MVAGPVAVLSENGFASRRGRRRRFEVTCGGGDGGGGGCGGGGGGGCGGCGGVARHQAYNMRCLY